MVDTLMDLLHIPAFYMIAGAFILPLLSKKLRPAVFIIFPIITLWLVLFLPDGFEITSGFTAYELLPVKVDALSRVFATVFSIIAITGGIYAWHMKDLGQQSSALVYAGSAIGVAYAGDFFTMLVFWELMAFSSAWLIWARKKEESQKAGMRYLIVHAFGGGVLLAGILAHMNETGSILITSFPDEFTLASSLMLIGVAVNAAVPPLHAWLADAYPKATITGAVFMSAFTTKSAMYVLIRLYPGWDILIWVGLMMAIYGAIFALISNDIRQILAYSIISQLGYIVAGIGIGTELALNGAAAHAFNHILYKSLLFMGAGAVIYATGTSKLTELGGLASKMKWVVGFYMVGALSISGLPLLNGYISKSMIADAALDGHFEIVALGLIIATVGTFLHTGLKLPYYTWFGSPSGKSAVETAETPLRPIPKNMIIAMGIGASMCVLFGVYPSLLYGQLPYPVDHHPFSTYHIVEMVQILGAGFIIFWLFKKHLAGRDVIVIDTDWFYRKPAGVVRSVFVNAPDRFFGVVETIVLDLASGVTRAFVNPMTWLNPLSSEGNEASSYSPPMASVLGFVLFVFVLIGLFLVF